MVQRIGRLAGQGKNLAIDFEFGKLVIRMGRSKFEFEAKFLQKILRVDEVSRRLSSKGAED